MTGGGINGKAALTYSQTPPIPSTPPPLPSTPPPPPLSSPPPPPPATPPERVDQPGIVRAKVSSAYSHR